MEENIENLEKISFPDLSLLKFNQELINKLTNVNELDSKNTVVNPFGEYQIEPCDSSATGEWLTQENAPWDTISEKTISTGTEPYAHYNFGLTDVDMLTPEIHITLKEGLRLNENMVEQISGLLYTVIFLDDYLNFIADLEYNAVEISDTMFAVERDEGDYIVVETHRFKQKSHKYQAPTVHRWSYQIKDVKDEYPIRDE